MFFVNATRSFGKIALPEVVLGAATLTLVADRSGPGGDGWRSPTLHPSQHGQTRQSLGKVAGRKAAASAPVRKVHFAQKRFVARIAAQSGQRNVVLNETEQRVALLMGPFQPVKGVV